MKYFRLIVFSLISVIFVYLIPFLNIVVVSSNAEGIIAIVSVCSVLSSAAAASSCSAKFLGKKENGWLAALIIPSLSISVFVFCACLAYQYFNILLMHVSFLIILTVVANLLTLALLIISYFLGFDPTPDVTAEESKEAKEFAEKASGDGETSGGINVTRKGGAKQ